MKFGFSEVCVRSNFIEIGLVEDDLKVVLIVKELFDFIVVFKVEIVEYLDWVILEFIFEEYFNIRFLVKLCKRIVFIFKKMFFMFE